MKETILYISKSEQDIRSFLKYLQSKLKAEQKECTLDEERDILKVPKYYDIVGKSVHGNMLGVGYGYCKYYCFSEAYDKDKYSNTENERLKDILMHTREGAEEISGLDILCMLGLVWKAVEEWNIKKNGTLVTGAVWKSSTTIVLLQILR